MTREDIIRMAQEAGFPVQKWDDGLDEVMDGDNYHIQTDQVIDFANLVAAAERNKVAQWIMARGYSTGHGDTVDDLLKELNWQVREEERELCAQLCEEFEQDMGHGIPQRCADAIRARAEK
jgi:hypothetical protein